jgi:hypothetical protein
VRTPTTTAIAMLVVTGGTGALGSEMVGALIEAGAARARRCLKFCEIAGIKADGSAQDWASLISNA